MLIPTKNLLPPSGHSNTIISSTIKGDEEVRRKSWDTTDQFRLQIFCRFPHTFSRITDWKVESGGRKEYSSLSSIFAQQTDITMSQWDRMIGSLATTISCLRACRRFAVSRAEQTWQQPVSWPTPRMVKLTHLGKTSFKTNMKGWYLCMYPITASYLAPWYTKLLFVGQFSLGTV